MRFVHICITMIYVITSPLLEIKAFCTVSPIRLSIAQIRSGLKFNGNLKFRQERIYMSLYVIFGQKFQIGLIGGRVQAGINLDKMLFKRLQLEVQVK